MSSCNLQTAVDNIVVQEGAAHVFSHELCINTVDQIILWTECNLTTEVTVWIQGIGNYLQQLIK